MAVTNENSTEFANQTASPVVPLEPNEFQGSIQIAHFDFTQGVAAGDANSTLELIRMKAGRVRIVDIEFACSAFGASRVLDIGYRAHTNIDGVTAVAEDDNAYSDDLDVSAAADVRDFVDVVTESFDGFDIFAKVTGGTIPAGATVKGVIRYVRESN